MKAAIDINSDAVTMRKNLGEDVHSPVDIFTLLGNREDLTITFIPMSERISGICIREESNNLIAINSTLSYGRQRFTAAHEMYHLYFHKDFDKIICSKDIDTNKDPGEIEADSFASYFLAPYEALKYFIEQKLGESKGKLTVNDVVGIEQQFGMSRQAILWRLVKEKYISRHEAEGMKTGIIRSALRLGYDDRLYVPASKDRLYFTFGKYIKMAEELKEKEIVSTGKYEELLLSAFRGDIVFGLVAEGEDSYD